MIERSQQVIAEPFRATTTLPFLYQLYGYNLAINNIIIFYLKTIVHKKQKLNFYYLL